VLRLAPDHRAFNRAGLLGMRRSRSHRVDGGGGVCAVGVPLARSLREVRGGAVGIFIRVLWTSDEVQQADHEQRKQRCWAVELSADR